MVLAADDALFGLACLLGLGRPAARRYLLVAHVHDGKNTPSERLQE